MRDKREAAQRAAEVRRLESEGRRVATEEARRKAAEARPAVEEVIAPLRSLGFRADEARHAAALCAAIPEAPLEERVRRALSYFQPPGRVSSPAPIGPA